MTEYLETLPKSDWDKIIHSIIKRYEFLYKKFEHEDLEQEAWIALLEASKRFDPVAHPKIKFSSYAYRAIEFAFFRLIREIKCPVSFQDIDYCEIETSGGMDDLVEDEWIGHIFKQLDKREDRRLVYMYFVDKQTYKQIGEKIGVSHETARQKINKILSELRDENISDI